MQDNINIINEAYNIIGGYTPLKKNADCGKLCGKICCKGKDSGMLLFPGEEEILKDIPGFYIERIEYMDTPGINLLLCDGTCDRNLRPFACRIFPAAPEISLDENNNIIISVRADIRGRHMCPLWDLNPDYINENFLDSVSKAFNILAKNKDALNLMRLISDEIAEIKRFL